MLTLRPMQPTEFSNTATISIVDYAQEIAANFGYSIEKSSAIAAKELADDLPQNVTTPDNFLYVLKKATRAQLDTCGTKQIDAGTSVFILDFVILGSFS